MVVILEDTNVCFVAPGEHGASWVTSPLCAQAETTADASFLAARCSAGI